ncbi:MAG: hypothetical protein OXI46_04075 [Gemmatimonadota bacterium]|nr:hypothetical protein [Gemmatimonadota bacterium]
MSDERTGWSIVDILRDGSATVSRASMAVPDNMSDVEDRRATALVTLPPSARHDPGPGPKSAALEAPRGYRAGGFLAVDGDVDKLGGRASRPPRDWGRQSVPPPFA